ncbi:MAG: hypothetical protein RLO51_11215 [Thalassobaculum sp.]|uniref:RusA family crossover junction endodeoxyribonuclease n=1 Tax=Thalassobaculum sp. TaxID=2022740 RepID=UPI0032EEA097
MTLEILGRIPSKKNSLRRIKRGHRVLTAASLAYEAWHRDASYQIARLRPSSPIERCEVTITFYAPDRRRADLTNKAESVMDLLVDCGFLADDNWHVVPGVELRLGGIHVKKPRAIVVLKEIV